MPDDKLTIDIHRLVAASDAVITALDTDDVREVVSVLLFSLGRVCGTVFDERAGMAVTHELGCMQGILILDNSTATLETPEPQADADRGQSSVLSSHTCEAPAGAVPEGPQGGVSE
jgi:hypothetical protein